MKSSDQINEIAKSLARAQGAMMSASKDKNNPFFKSKYADLASCWDSCREQLSANNLAVVQTTASGQDGDIIINTVLMHESGQWIEGELTLKPVKNEPQGIGSAITYGRRYALMGIVGIAPSDDDGEAAMGRGKKKDARADAFELSSLKTSLSQCNSPKRLDEIRVDISNGKYGHAKKEEAKKLLIARMTEMGAMWSNEKECFILAGASSEPPHSYEWWIDKADAVKGDLLAWWEVESGPASNDLSPDEMKKLNSYVSQLIDIAGEEAEKSDESCQENDEIPSMNQWTTAAQNIVDQVDKLESSMAVDNYRASKRRMIDALGDESIDVFRYIENVYQQLIKGEQE